MIWKQLLFINDLYYGEMDRGLVPVHETVQPPSSIAYFCAICGIVWARAVVEGKRYTIWDRRCGQHPTIFASEKAGSIWIDWDRYFTDALPEAALRRELEIHLLYAEKELGI